MKIAGFTGPKKVKRWSKKGPKKVKKTIDRTWAGNLTTLKGKRFQGLDFFCHSIVLNRRRRHKNPGRRTRLIFNGVGLWLWPSVSISIIIQNQLEPDMNHKTNWSSP